MAFEAGFSFNPDFEELLNASLGEQAGVADNYGEAFYLKNYHFESFDLSHQVLPGFTINHNFTAINVNREEQVDWTGRNSFPIRL